jgi:uncharacterized phage protein (TIGR01671 family)
MRDILFKAKTEMIVRTYNNGLDDGEWVKGYLRCDCGMWLIYQFEYDRADQVAYEVNPETICQWTGLTDKNGNKIWENDVVKYHFGDDVAQIKFGKYQSCFDSQKTCHVGFFVDWQKGYMRKDLGYWVEMIDCNIVGNIFDNPELIGGDV